jgi:hypothetical protein
MNRFAAIALVSLLLTVGLAVGCSEEQSANREEVSFDQLFGNPDQYRDKYVTVEGFYFGGFEIMALSEKLEYSGYAEGHLEPRGRMVWIEGGIPREVYDRLHKQQMMGPPERYGKLRVEGKFEYGAGYGHLGAYGAQIVPLEVELLQWSPRAKQ